MAMATALAASPGATARSPDPSVTPDEPTPMPEALQESAVAPCPVMADAEASVPAERDVDEASGLVVVEPTLELCPAPHRSFRTIIDAGVGRVHAKSIPRLSDWDKSYIKDRCTAGTSASRLQGDPMRLRRTSARSQRKLGCLVLLTEAWSRFLEQPVETSSEPAYEAASRIYQYAAEEFGPKLRERYARALLAYEAARLTDPRPRGPGRGSVSWCLPLDGRSIWRHSIACSTRPSPPTSGP